MHGVEHGVVVRRRLDRRQPSARERRQDAVDALGDLGARASRRRPTPRALGSCAGCRATTPRSPLRGRHGGQTAARQTSAPLDCTARCRYAQHPRLGVTIGRLPTGPTNSLGRHRRRRRRPHHNRPRRGRRRRTDAASRGPASRVISVAEDAYRRPVPAGGAVLNGAGECTGFLTAAEWAIARDADPADLDDAARPRLRRRVRAHGRGGPERRRRGRHPGRRRVRRLVPQLRGADAGDAATTSRPPGGRHASAADPGAAAEQGSVGRRNRDGVPRVQGRDRRVVARDRRAVTRSACS